MALSCRYDRACPQKDHVGKAKNFEVYSGHPMDGISQGEV